MIRSIAKDSLAGFKDFISRESSGGYVLMVAAALGLLIANSPFASGYFQLLNFELGISLGLIHIEMTILHWINDALMAVFFLLVGLEIKREVIDGHLSSLADTLLPSAAALGGVLIPAAIYLSVADVDPAARSGWAIPAATDIAFALGILALAGSKVPTSLKILLTAIAVIDDLMAILIIALFYTDQLHTQPLMGAALIVFILVMLNVLKIKALWAYGLLGILLWAFVHETGVHATLAGVALALTIPMQATHDNAKPAPPLQRLEAALHTPVAFIIVPLFGFANAGVSLLGLTFNDLLAPVPLGVALGLFVGKQIGVFGVAWAMVRLGWARLPRGATMMQVYGMSVLCGVGFTMSLFIGALAFDAQEMVDRTKLGVFAGSLLSAAWGLTVLLSAPRRTTS